MNNKWYTVVGLTVLVTVTTYLIAVPLPGGGYFNFGDVAVVFAALIMGRYGGALAGGIGSALADILLGWAAFAPITFVAKGLEGFFAGFGSGVRGFKTVLFPIIGALSMVAVYFLAEGILPQYGWAMAVSEIPANLIQAVGAVIGGRLLFGLAEIAFKEKPEEGNKE